jgi:hypothetical protein
MTILDFDSHKKDTILLQADTFSFKKADLSLWPTAMLSKQKYDFMVNKCKSLYQHVQLNQVVITLV